MDTLIDRARRLRRDSTAAERALWALLRAWQLDGHKIRRQAPIGPYIVDFLCHERRLIVEVDGGQHADEIAYDTRRTAWLNAKGYEVVRLWNNDVLEDPEAAAEHILTKLKARPLIPPKGREAGSRRQPLGRPPFPS